LVTEKTLMKSTNISIFLKEIKYINKSNSIKNKTYICDVFRTLKGYQPSVDTTVVKRYGLSIIPPLFRTANYQK
jgi:hypothetical protein